MNAKLPFKVKQAARGFHKQRSDYYAYMAAILRSSGGGIKILQLFENDIQRYEGEPRGVLCGYWHDCYSENGGNLADSLQGTVPDDEVAIIRVSQDAGGDALLYALEDVARMAKLTDKVRSESIGTLMAGLVAIILATAMLTAFPVFSINAISNAYDFLPLEFWGKHGKSLTAYSKWIESYVVYVALVLMIVLVYVYWSIGNLISPVRNWLDEHIVLYKVIRDLKGALFLTTMSTLSRKRGAGMVATLKQNLETFSDSARSPWLKWRIDQIIDGSDATGAIGVQAFNTGFISREMFFFLEDMQKARGFAEGFQETGNYVEGKILTGIIGRMLFYRWALLIASLVVTLGMFIWQFQVIYEMRGAMSSYLATG